MESRIAYEAAAAAKSTQSCLTLYDPIDCSPQGSPVPGILQARTLEWVAIPFSDAWKWKVKVKSLSHVRLLVIPWTAAFQAPLSMGFSRQEYWSGLPLPSPLMRRQWIYSPKEVFQSLVLIWASFRSGTHYLEDLDPQEEGSWNSRTRKIKMSFSISLWGTIYSSRYAVRKWDI